MGNVADYRSIGLNSLPEPGGCLAECFTPAHQEMVTRPDKWDMTKLNRWGRAMGQPVQGDMDRARPPGKPGSLEFP